MPKHSNNRPWPDNLRYDFNLPPTISSSDAEVFIYTLPTTERNRAFLLLRYRDGKTYKEIAAIHDMTPAGVRLTIIAMQEKFGGEAASASALPAGAPASTASPVPATPSVAPLPVPTVATPPTVPAAPTVALPHVGNNSTKESSRPLSINLAAIRRFLGLTPEEFAQPLPIEDGESLITRLETGFSKASATILDLLCEAWEINRKYLITGQGEMFELQPYCDGLVSLLKKYLAVATFDGKGQQYWKGSLVDDLGQLIDVGKLNGREMCRVIRVLYDYLDVEQFEVMLKRMGR